MNYLLKPKLEMLITFHLLLSKLSKLGLLLKETSLLKLKTAQFKLKIVPLVVSKSSIYIIISPSTKALVN